MKIQLFGELAQLAGSGEIEIEPQPDVKTLRSAVIKRYPAFEKQFFRVAVDLVLVGDEAKISGQEEIVLLPAFAGG